MLPGDPFDPEFLKTLQAVTEALVGCLPQHLKSGYCVIQQVEGHAPGRLRYQIGSDESPGEGTTQPSTQLHEAAFALYRLWTKNKSAFPGARASVAEQPDGQWKCDVRRLDGNETPPTEEQQEQAWDAVYRARKQFFTESFGPLPNDIQKLMNLMGVWPGGGLFTYEATRRNGLGISTTFGLTNYDMPTPVTLEQYEQKQDSAGRPGSFTSSLQARVPRWVPADRAGYGYELLILTPSPDNWPLLPLSWFTQMEILKDVNLVGRVDEYQGLTVESIKIGDGSQSADFLVTPALDPLPPAVKLPNGTMRLLVATRITREEMNFSLEQGRLKLLERLQQGGVRQVSDLRRASVA
jgi:hypothetical protein